MGPRMVRIEVEVQLKDEVGEGIRDVAQSDGIGRAIPVLEPGACTSPRISRDSD